MSFLEQPLLLNDTKVRRVAQLHLTRKLHCGLYDVCNGGFIASVVQMLIGSTKIENLLTTIALDVVFEEEEHKDNHIVNELAALYLHMQYAQQSSVCYSHLREVLPPPMNTYLKNDPHELLLILLSKIKEVVVARNSSMQQLRWSLNVVDELYRDDVQPPPQDERWTLDISVTKEAMCSSSTPLRTIQDFVSDYFSGTKIIDITTSSPDVLFVFVKYAETGAVLPLVGDGANVIKVPFHDKSTASYALRAVVMFHIETAHFVAYRRRSVGSAWHCFDDTSVTAQAPQHTVGDVPYLLLYERSDNGSPLLRKTIPGFPELKQWIDNRSRSFGPAVPSPKQGRTNVGYYTIGHSGCAASAVQALLSCHRVKENLIHLGLTDIKKGVLSREDVDLQRATSLLALHSQLSKHRTISIKEFYERLPAPYNDRFGHDVNDVLTVLLEQELNEASVTWPLRFRLNTSCPLGVHDQQQHDRCIECNGELPTNYFSDYNEKDLHCFPLLNLHTTNALTLQHAIDELLFVRCPHCGWKCQNDGDVDEDEEVETTPPPFGEARILRFDQPPRNIIVQLPRFSTDQHAESKSTRGFPLTNSIVVPAVCGPVTYTLIAVVAHIGLNVSKGHYVTYRKENNGTWHCLADATYYVADPFTSVSSSDVCTYVFTRVGVATKVVIYPNEAITSWLDLREPPQMSSSTFAFVLVHVTVVALCLVWQSLPTVTAFLVLSSSSLSSHPFARHITYTVTLLFMVAYAILYLVWFVQGGNGSDAPAVLALEDSNSNTYNIFLSLVPAIIAAPLCLGLSVPSGNLAYPSGTLSRPTSLAIMFLLQALMSALTPTLATVPFFLCFMLLMLTRVIIRRMPVITNIVVVALHIFTILDVCTYMLVSYLLQIGVMSPSSSVGKALYVFYGIDNENTTNWTHRFDAVSILVFVTEMSYFYVSAMHISRHIMHRGITDKDSVLKILKGTDKSLFTPHMRATAMAVLAIVGIILEILVHPAIDSIILLILSFAAMIIESQRRFVIHILLIAKFLLLHLEFITVLPFPTPLDEFGQIIMGHTQSHTSVVEMFTVRLLSFVFLATWLVLTESFEETLKKNVFGNGSIDSSDVELTSNPASSVTDLMARSYSTIQQKSKSSRFSGELDSVSVSDLAEAARDVTLAAVKDSVRRKKQRDIDAVFDWYNNKASDDCIPNKEWRSLFGSQSLPPAMTDDITRENAMLLCQDPLSDDDVHSTLLQSRQHWVDILLKNTDTIALGLTYVVGTLRVDAMHMIFLVLLLLLVAFGQRLRWLWTVLTLYTMVYILATVMYNVGFEKAWWVIPEYVGFVRWSTPFQLTWYFVLLSLAAVESDKNEDFVIPELCSLDNLFARRLMGRVRLVVCLILYIVTMFVVAGFESASIMSAAVVIAYVVVLLWATFGKIAGKEEVIVVESDKNNSWMSIACRYNINPTLLQQYNDVDEVVDDDDDGDRKKNASCLRPGDVVRVPLDGAELYHTFQHLRGLVDLVLVPLSAVCLFAVYALQFKPISEPLTEYISREICGSDSSTTCANRFGIDFESSLPQSIVLMPWFLCAYFTYWLAMLVNKDIKRAKIFTARAIPEAYLPSAMKGRLTSSDSYPTAPLMVKVYSLVRYQVLSVLLHGHFVILEAALAFGWITSTSVTHSIDLVLYFVVVVYRNATVPLYCSLVHVVWVLVRVLVRSFSHNRHFTDDFMRQIGVDVTPDGLDKNHDVAGAMIIFTAACLCESVRRHHKWLEVFLGKKANNSKSSSVSPTDNLFAFFTRVPVLVLVFLTVLFSNMHNILSAETIVLFCLTVIRSDGVAKQQRRAAALGITVVLMLYVQVSFVCSIVLDVNRAASVDWILMDPNRYHVLCAYALHAIVLNVWRCARQRQQRQQQSRYSDEHRFVVVDIDDSVQFASIQDDHTSMLSSSVVQAYFCPEDAEANGDDDEQDLPVATDELRKRLLSPAPLETQPDSDEPVVVHNHSPRRLEIESIDNDNNAVSSFRVFLYELYTLLYQFFRFHQFFLLCVLLLFHVANYDLSLFGVLRGFSVVCIISSSHSGWVLKISSWVAKCGAPKRFQLTPLRLWLFAFVVHVVEVLFVLILLSPIGTSSLKHNCESRRIVRDTLTESSVSLVLWASTMFILYITVYTSSDDLNYDVIRLSAARWHNQRCALKADAAKERKTLDETRDEVRAVIDSIMVEKESQHCQGDDNKSNHDEHHHHEHHEHHEHHNDGMTLLIKTWNYIKTSNELAHERREGTSQRSFVVTDPCLFVIQSLFEFLGNHTETLCWAMVMLWYVNAPNLCEMIGPMVVFGYGWVVFPWAPRGYWTSLRAYICFVIAVKALLQILFGKHYNASPLIGPLSIVDAMLLIMLQLHLRQWADHGRFSTRSLLQDREKGPTWSVDKISNAWLNFSSNLQRTEACGRDYYVTYLTFDIIVLITFCLSFHSFVGAPSMSIFSSVSDSLLPGSLVLFILLFITLMLVDRGIYMARSSLAKYYLNVVQAILVLILYYYFRGRVKHSSFHADVIIIVIKLFSLSFSSMQVRAGFPTNPGHDFLTDGEAVNSAVFRFLAACFHGAPFVWELRNVVDWVCASTRLDFKEWVKLEAIHHELYMVKVHHFYVMSHLAGKTKIYLHSVVPVLVFILCLLPLGYYSTFNPLLKANAVTNLDFELRLEGADVMYKASVKEGDEHDLNTLSASSVTNLRHDYPFLDDYAVRAKFVQQVHLDTCSPAYWRLTPPALATLLKHLNPTTTTKDQQNFIDLEISLSLRREKDHGDEKIAHTTYKLNADQQLQLASVITGVPMMTKDKSAAPETTTLTNGTELIVSGVSMDAELTLTMLLSDIQNTSSSYSSSKKRNVLSSTSPIQLSSSKHTYIARDRIGQNQVIVSVSNLMPTKVVCAQGGQVELLGQAISLNNYNNNNNKTENRYITLVVPLNYLILRCNGETNITYTPHIGNSSQSALLSLPHFISKLVMSRKNTVHFFTEPESKMNCEIHLKREQGVTAPYWCVSCNKKDGVPLYIVGDYLPSAAILPDISLIVVYTTFILAIGKVMRSVLVTSQSPHNIPLQEAVDTEYLEKVIESVYHARRMVGVLPSNTERVLFYHLIDILRKPDELYRRTAGEYHVDG
eukprot:PhM_4_TR16762/c0_g1_i1/m.75152